MAKRGSEEWRRNVSRGTKRGQRPWKDAFFVLPKHVRVFYKRHQVDESIRPMLEDALVLVGELAHQLGGVEALTAAEKATLRSLFRSVVIIDSAFSGTLRRGDLRALDGLAALLQVERAALAALGLKKRERPAPELAEYLEQRYHGQEAGSGKVDDSDESAVLRVVGVGYGPGESS